jgi:beta-galactosidase
VDGRPRGQGRFPVGAIPPKQKASLEWKAPKDKITGREASLLVRFYAKSAQPWCEAGHLVAWQHVELPARLLAKPKPVPAAAKPLIEMPESPDSSAAIRCGSLDLVLDKQRGGLAGLGKEGVPILVAAPALSVWRAPTDNDGIKLWSGQGSKPLGRWQALGLDKVESRLVAATFKNAKGTGPVWTWKFEATGRGNWKDFLWSYSLSLPAVDSFRLQAEILAGKGMEDLPRVGLLFELAPGWENLSWLGLGPLENYPDRKSCVWRAEHSGTVTGQYVPYIMPQEHGLKCETDWMTLARESARLRLSSPRPFAFNASHFHPQDLTAAKHTVDLAPRKETVLCIDAAHRGLGTASCGPDTFEAYRIKGKRFALDLHFRLED